MDRRSWLWRRKSSEKSPGESESSGSLSSHSERYSDDHEPSKGSPNNASSYCVQSPEVTSSIGNGEVHETVKSLSEKLSAALLNINAKEDLVKQHAKVAEEAVSGWEKAEIEVATLKQQLEVALQKNSSLEDRLGHLDGALKECVRELRQSREDQEQKIHEAITKKTRVWESERFELESQLSELQTQLEAAKAEAASSIIHDIYSKLEASEKENAALKVELLALAKDLQKQTIERNLSIQAAETASKQHLESIKKVAKLEAECRRIRSMERKATLMNDHKLSNSVCLESVTDSQSESGDRFSGVDIEANYSDPWATALIAELDQFKNEKANTRILGTSIEIELMDDFLEMERLVALPEAESGSLAAEAEADKSRGSLKVETDAMRQKVIELEEKIEKIENEKAELELAFSSTQKRLEVSTDQLNVAEMKLAELQRQLDLADKSKQLAMLEIVDTEEKRKILESQIELAQSQIRKLSENVSYLEGKVDKEKALSADLKSKLETVEASQATKEALESQLQSAYFEADQLRNKIGMLEREVIDGKALSTEYIATLEALEAERKVLENQLESENQKVKKTQNKVILLEREVNEGRVLSTELIGKLETAETARKALESQLELSHLEVWELRDKLRTLERKFEEEIASSASLGTKCRTLEDELSRRKQETELRRVAALTGEMKIKQEKELSVAAGKLADCQKTIASLNRHLKLLTSFDNLMLEDEIPELDDKLPDLRVEGVRQLHDCDSSAGAGSSPFPNGEVVGDSPSLISSSSSTLYEFAKFISRSRISSQAENQ